MDSFAVVVGALLLDWLLGEPRRWHPLEGFGRLALTAEHHFYRGTRGRGALMVGVLVPPAMMAAAVLAWGPYGWLAELLFLYLALGGRSLAEHSRRVAAALCAGDLSAARRLVRALVSRDSEEMDAEGVSKATVESVLENGNDAVVGVLVWYLVGGAPGVVAYRLINTLDAMWGYRSERYANFGWAAARLDDLLNWVPARLTALSYALAGDTGSALGAWRRQAEAWKSPNAGPVMAAGAGALRIQLGGTAVYHGYMESRPILGYGRPACVEDVERALQLQRWALWLFLSVLGSLILVTVLLGAAD